MAEGIQPASLCMTELLFSSRTDTASEEHMGKHRDNGYYTTTSNDIQLLQLLAQP